MTEDQNLGTPNNQEFNCSISDSDSGGGIDDDQLMYVNGLKMKSSNDLSNSNLMEQMIKAVINLSDLHADRHINQDDTLNLTYNAHSEINSFCRRCQGQLRSSN